MTRLEWKYTSPKPIDSASLPAEFIPLLTQFREEYSVGYH